MILNHLKSMSNPLEEIVLQKRSYADKDALGNQTEEWEDELTLIGVINDQRIEKKVSEGVYDQTKQSESGGFIGVFIAFKLPNLQDYRLKRTFYASTPIVDYFDIIGANDDLYRKGRRHHVEMQLRRAKL